MVPPAVIVPAEPAFLEDGTLYSASYRDVYASADGAVAETRHVFLGGNGLPFRWQAGSAFTIIETGFGAGLNFLATWSAWRAHAPGGARLHYLSVEKHPFGEEDLKRVHARWPDLESLGGQLRQRYPPLVPGFHRLRFDGGGVSLTLLLGEGLEMLRQVDACADAFYLDGFAPSRNPELWSAEIFQELGRLAAPGATAATYSVAGVVRDGLSAAGFAVERREGFGRKREMLTARFAKERGARDTISARRHVVLIGAGLAGTSCAAHLAQRGWSVDLIERHAEPACEASGNPAGLLMPAFSLDWNPPTRLTEQALTYARSWLDDLAAVAGSPVWQPSGVLQLARDEVHLERQRRVCDAFRLPAALIRLVDRVEAGAIAGRAAAEAGWWLPSAGWADPRAVCRAGIVEGVRPLFGSQALGLRCVGDEWEVLGGNGAVLARAPVIVLANARDAKTIQGCEQLPLDAMRGQVSFLPQIAERSLAVPVCREGFITPAMDGFHCVGASYNLGSEERRETIADHQGNLERLERILPGFARGIGPNALFGRVGFRTVAPDRMPVLGALLTPDKRSGLFACLGLASRGLTWSPLLAETLACLITREPLPIERDLLKLVAPARFARRH